MPKTPITELDFFAAKEQLKTYLRSQTRFKDFDFDGSNMSVLLDVLAYNTYQNNFYTNMALSEMFLDSAQRENSIVSHAKELNYLPRSRKSAMAVVDVTIVSPETTGSTLTIPIETRFTTNYNGVNYNFYANKSYIARRISSSSNVFFVGCVEIYEGEIVTETFYPTEDNEIIPLTNENIDITSLRVFTNILEPSLTLEYVYKRDIFGNTEIDPVFYLQPSVDGTYQIEFGRNVFGISPKIGEDVTVSYRITNGESANGSNIFTTSFFQNARITTRATAIGGAERESLSDIKFFAPKSIQIQERAVTQSDYELLLKQRFNEIRDVSVYGGDELDPPRFGKVAISVNVDGGISENAKRLYINYLSDKTPLAIQPLFVDAEFLYANLNVEVAYQTKSTTKSAAQLESDIRQAISDYNKNSLSKFGSSLRISKLSNIIDEIDNSILGSNISATPYVEYAPSLNVKRSPSFNFATALKRPYPLATNPTREQFRLFKPSVKSTNFNYEGTDSFLQDDGSGKIQIVSTNIVDLRIINPNIGTVDYSTGIIRLVDFEVRRYLEVIKILADTIEMDIESPRTRILEVKNSDVIVKLVDKR
jgi:hypothetical protein